MSVATKSILRDAQISFAPGLAQAMAASTIDKVEVKHCLERFLEEDWGDLSPRACQANNLLLKHRLEPLMGLYNTSKGRVAIIASQAGQERYQLVQVALYSEVPQLQPQLL